MIKKGIFVAASIAAALLIAGCAHHKKPMPQEPMAPQAGPSIKLGKMGMHHGHAKHQKKHKHSF